MRYFTALVNKIANCNLKRQFLWSILILFLTSCDFTKQEIIAKVDSHELHYEDVYRHFQQMNIPIDDQKLVDEFVTDWIKQKVVDLELKELNPSAHYENQHQAEKNRYALNLFSMENKIIEERLDTLITEDEILQYYRNNRDNYISKSYIVKALYIKIPDSISVSEKLKTAFLLKKDKDREVVKKYGNLYATNFYFEEDKWIFFEDLVRDIPMTEDSKEQLIKNKEHAVFTDKNDIYLLNIFDFRYKRSETPLDFEKEKIRKHILKRRINTLREEIRINILENAKEKYIIERY